MVGVGLGIAVLLGAGVLGVVSIRSGRHDGDAPSAASGTTTLAPTMGEKPVVDPVPTLSRPGPRGLPPPATRGAAPPPPPPPTSARPAVAPTSPPPSAPIVPVTAPTPSAVPGYNASGAFVALEGLTTERVRDEVVRRKMHDLLPRFTECYRSALVMAGAPSGGHASIHLSIDATGAMSAFVTAKDLPSFQRCVSGVFTGQKVPESALDGPGATAEQTLRLNP
jgi:hypothetical protein